MVLLAQDPVRDERPDLEREDVDATAAGLTGRGEEQREQTVHDQADPG